MNSEKSIDYNPNNTLFNESNIWPNEWFNESQETISHSSVYSPKTKEAIFLTQIEQNLSFEFNKISRNNWWNQLKKIELKFDSKIVGLFYYKEEIKAVTGFQTLFSITEVNKEFTRIVIISNYRYINISTLSSKFFTFF